MAHLGRLKLLKGGAVVRRCIGAAVCRHYGSIYEPDYLDSLGPPHPVYDLLNVRAKCYDFTVAEHYARFVHRTANSLGFNVINTWATPPRVFDVSTLKPRSTLVDQKYTLSLYERNVQVCEVPCYMLSTFIHLIKSSLPEGVELSVHPHQEEDEEIRYIPDTELLQLKSQLNEMVNPVVKGKKKT